MFIFTLMATTTAIVACSPKIYVIDRQSVLEEEAAGRWPDFDKMLMADALETTPTPLAIAAESDRAKKRLQILNAPFLVDKSTETPPHVTK